MLFSEIYSSYFNVVAAVLSEATQHTLTGAKLNDIVVEKAFAESVLTIPTALQEKWPLLKDDFTTPVQHCPVMPLTLLQKRWLKALLQDRRIALFAPSSVGLEDVEPLFNMDDVVWFDQYLDGDPYQDEKYAAVFRQILNAIKEHRRIRLSYSGHKGAQHRTLCIPYRLEYSEKDDKFRVLATGGRSGYTINLARIQACELLEQVDSAGLTEPRRKLRSLTFLLRDERNALERVLLHFSHFEKETIRLGEREYQVTLRYERDDETELLIRILSFGPMIKVISPDNFIDLVRERLQKQESCGL